MVLVLVVPAPLPYALYLRVSSDQSRISRTAGEADDAFDDAPAAAAAEEEEEGDDFFFFRDFLGLAGAPAAEADAAPGTYGCRFRW